MHSKHTGKHRRNRKQKKNKTHKHPRKQNGKKKINKVIVRSLCPIDGIIVK